jgi:carbon storage regulator
MLVLSRKQSEKLFIGEDICVTVVRLGDGQVRLGIEAPRAVSIVRAELRERDRLTRTPGLRHRVHNAVMTARSETVTAGVS